VSATASALDTAPVTRSAPGPNPSRGGIATGSPSASKRIPRALAREASGNAAEAAVDAEEASSASARSRARCDARGAGSSTRITARGVRRRREPPREERWNAVAAPAPSAAAPAATTGTGSPLSDDMVSGARPDVAHAGANNDPFL
jgi:hypothetical protein